MGFSITFICHPKKDKAYDMENTKTFTKKVGKEEEDTPLEEVALLIKDQLARRDVLVIEYEVYEFTKKRVKCRETKGGVILKDRKFLFDEVRGTVSGQDAGPEQPPGGFVNLAVPQRTPQSLRQATTNDIPMPMHPLRMEMFDADPMQLARMPKSLKFTNGKKYPVYKEYSEGVPPMNVTKYVTKDDRGMEVSVSAEYFVAAGRGLIGGDFGGDPVEREMNKRLAFQGQYMEDAGIPVQRNVGGNIKVDDGTIPAELMAVPDLSKLRGKV